MSSVTLRVTETGGRDATTRRIPPKLALAVGMPSTPAPTGWQWTSLTELARLESGHTPSRRHPDYWGGTIPWIGIQDAKGSHGGYIHDTTEHTNDLGIANSSARVLPQNTVCLSRTASVGYVVVMARPMATSQDFVNWVCSKLLDHNFLKYLFIAEGEDLLRFASGAVHSTIYFPEAKAFHICFPPLPEQRRIVAILDEALEGIATAKANAEKNLQNARALIQPTFMAILRSLDHTSWLASTVEGTARPEKGSIRTGPFGSQLLHSEFVDEGIPVLGIDNAVQNRFTWNERRYITPQKFTELSRYQVKPGDVLITIMGTCGRCAIVPEDIATAINSKHLCCITLDHRKCLPEFLHAYFLYHPTAQEFLSKKAKGAIMAGLNMGIIKELPLLLPPVEQQRTITKKVAELRESAEVLESVYQQKLDALDELKKSLLYHAFSGQL